MQNPLADILQRVTPEHGRVLDWFARHEGDVGSRPWRQDGRSVIPGVDVPVVAQRGIHRPSGWQVALSVTATSNSMYLDGQPSPVDDATWVMPYKAHSGDQGSGSASRWNRALAENMRAHVPVGVFVPHRREYRNLGLAMVESYDPGSDTFLLRGPVRSSAADGTWDLDQSEDGWGVDTLAEEDPRVAALVRRRHRQDKFREKLLSAYAGRCAVTACDVPEALQGAHILAYSGRSSQRVENGLLLRADVHLLYDRHLISVDPGDLRVWLARPLMGTAYAGLHHQAVTLPLEPANHPSCEKLAVHWAVFERGAA